MNSSPAGKTKAVIAYITFVGMFIAVSMNKDKPEAFATWHIKNMFGLCLLMLVAIVSQYNINLLLGDILYITAFVLWCYSLAMAIANKTTGIPFFSKKFQTWFTFLG
ncbi:hypothetical protein G5B37_03160 [Rasiella rasia]|uniref:Chloroplast import component protein (Tic20) n=1 Tax=Rasiella rasia TaxID=2744027 RepID=A0A6G6GJ65_9FLAO|nr:hypothetical protein [Rasiella rasia]QIE58592.1 hypothetical protein G5B37_03160 [Rasiella rasia]